MVPLRGVAVSRVGLSKPPQRAHDCLSFLRPGTARPKLSNWILERHAFRFLQVVGGLDMKRMFQTLVCAAPLAACASYPAPQQHMADSQASVRGAEEVGAASQPQAALNLKLAQEELARAKALMGDDKNEEADYMALRAKSDADLALALAREHVAETRAQQTE